MKQKQKGIENALYQVLNQKLGLRWLCPSAPPKTIFLEFSYPSTYPKKIWRPLPLCTPKIDHYNFAE